VAGDAPADLQRPTLIRWSLVRESLRKPYRVTLPMVALVMLVPLYVFIPQFATKTPSVPALSLDYRIPLQPAWVLVYGPLYLFLILLPVFVVRQEELIRRTVFAYLAVWIASYVSFFFYPTVASRPDDAVIGNGFVVWGLRFLYSADPPYNCFPSLHVAHSFVSALSSYRVHRGVGIAATACALFVGLSTLFTKQHYILDVVAGIFLALVAYVLFLRRTTREDVAELDRRVAPALVLVVSGIVLLCFGWYVVLYMLGVEI
jgi:membrane-associated phospholipid phosphatase